MPYGYLIDPSSGALTAIGGSPFGLPSSGACGSYYDVAAEASGNFVYMADGVSGKIATYKVSPSTGELTQVSSSNTSPYGSNLTVVPRSLSSTAKLTGLTILPSEVQIVSSTLGKQHQFTVEGTFSDGSTRFLTGSAAWSLTNRSVATVLAGLATSKGYGETTITATMEGISATATLTVTPPPPPALTGITVTPATVTVYQGIAVQMTATGLYADGSTANITSDVAWKSSNQSVATVSAQGLVQTVAIGSATITATLQNITGSGTVTAITSSASKTPAPITYGTPLSSEQLDAAAERMSLANASFLWEFLPGNAQ